MLNNVSFRDGVFIFVYEYKYPCTVHSLIHHGCGRRNSMNEAGWSTHDSAAAVSSTEPSYHSVAQDKLASPGRRWDDELLCQVTKWLNHHDQWSNRKPLSSLRQQQNHEWTVRPHGARPSLSPPLGGYWYLYTNTPTSS